MNNLAAIFVQVLESGEYLRNNELCLFLRNLSILLEIEVQIRPLTQLQYSAEGVVVYLDSVKLSDYTPVHQVLVNLVLPYGVLNVVVFDLLRPRVVEVVHLASHFPTRLQVVGLIDLTITTFA